MGAVYKYSIRVIQYNHELKVETDDMDVYIGTLSEIKDVVFRNRKVINEFVMEKYKS